METKLVLRIKKCDSGFVVRTYVEDDNKNLKVDYSSRHAISEDRVSNVTGLFNKFMDQFLVAVTEQEEN